MAIFDPVQAVFARTSEQQSDVLKNSSLHDSESLNSCSSSDYSNSLTGATAGPGQVYLLGDSLGDGVKNLLPGELKEEDGWSIKADTLNSRPISKGIEIVKSKPEDLKSADHVVIILGTNPDSKTNADGITEMVNAIKEVNATAPIYWENINVTKPILIESATTFNEALNNADGIKIINNTVAPKESDGTHPSDYNALAKIIASALSGEAGSSTTINSTPSCCGSGGTTTLVGSDNGEKVWNFLISKGLNNVQAAGIMGNLQEESGFNPAATNSSSGAFGIVQWLPKEKLANHQQEAGIEGDSNTLGVQLGVMWWEATNAGKSPTGYSKVIIEEIKNLESTFKDPAGNLDTTGYLKAVRLYWHQYYEGSLGQGDAKRDAHALAWLNKAVGGVGSGASGTAVEPSSAGCSGSGQQGGGSDISAYSNPFHNPDGLVQSRIDRGVDYASTKPVPIYAIGNGEVTLATDKSTFYTTSGNGDGTKYSDWITYRLTDGPAAGKHIFISEACSPILVKVGDKVTKDTQLCSVLQDSIETGWAAGPTTQLPIVDSALYETHHGCKTAFGINFNQLMLKLGAMGGYTHASNQCVNNGGTNETILGELPKDWPVW